MADLAKLVVRLEAQSAQLTSELAKANGQIEKFASSSSRIVKQWAAGITAGFGLIKGIDLARSAIDSMDAINDLAQTAGTSTEEFSAMAYALKGAGIEADELTKINLKVSSSAVEAAKGSKTARAAWDALGISVKDAEGHVKSSNELILEAADAFSQYADGPEKAALASDLFGDKLAGRLIPFLNKGREGINALTKEAKDFGQVVSTDAAKAADNFNDNLDRLGAMVKGVVNKAVEEFLPNLEQFSNGLVSSAKESEAMDKAARTLATGLRLLFSAGVVVGEIFDRIGDAIGASAAAIVQFVQGNFKQAYAILKDGAEQAAASTESAADDLYNIWSDAGDKIAAKAVETDAKLKKTLSFGGDTSGLQEVKVTAQKIDATPTDEFYNNLNEQTKTSSELALTEYYKQKAALQELYEAGKIASDQYADRTQENLDKLLPDFEVTVKRVKETAESTLSEFDKAVAQNSVDIIANALESGFDEGANGVLRAFAVMLQKLAAQALAAELGKKIFGQSGGGEGSGWLQLALGAAKSYFGGGAASGRDHVSAGTSLMVGENGPEKFVPDVPGRVMSASEIAPQPQVNVPVQVVNVDDPNKIPNYFASQKGSQTFLNLLTDNRSTIRQILQGA